MDRQTQLWFSITIYQLGKYLQPIFQICYISWLTLEGKDGTILFNVSGCLILLLILISYYFLYISKENLLDENRNFLKYWILIVLESVIFLITISAYPSAVVYFTYLFKCNDHIKLLYPNGSENSTRLEVSEMNRSPQDLPDKTFDEEIENTTNILIDKALNIRSGIISFMHIEENSSEIVVTPKDEYSVITPLDGVAKDINIFVLVTICSFLSQLTDHHHYHHHNDDEYHHHHHYHHPQRRRVPPPPPPPLLLQRQRSPLQRASPPLERTPPPLERTPPPLERTPPPLERTPPPLERTQPPLERTPPPLERTPPLLERTPPPLERTQPPLERTPPPLERTQPPLERTQPPLERTPPPLERTPPPLERTPPPLERTPPPLERTPPPLERTPPPPERTPPPPERPPPPRINHKSQDFYN
ncbi:Salivary glue protein Sgs-4 [Armadillidium vulgare]|nr:Salivary glue protein Sgs-4 [Armadillidium vulgare]